MSTFTRIKQDSAVAAQRPVASERPVERAMVVSPLALSRSKLRFKNRWLISVDIVASLARAGVYCDIVVPNMEPVRDGYDPSLPKH